MFLFPWGPNPDRHPCLRRSEPPLLGDEPHAGLRYFCSPQHTNTALYPVISQMERAAGLAHDDSMQLKLNKLDAGARSNIDAPTTRGVTRRDAVLPHDGRYPALDLAPEQRRQRILEAFV